MRVELLWSLQKDVLVRVIFWRLKESKAPYGELVYMVANSINAVAEKG